MAQGSHKTYGGWESKVCERCGGKLTLSGPACIWMYNPTTKGSTAWHLSKCP